MTQEERSSKSDRSLSRPDKGFISIAARPTEGIAGHWVVIQHQFWLGGIAHGVASQNSLSQN
ncbi:MAG TPA: hypothetical protein IGS37_18325 [Synechococcales cyanobacterium M55_K2018_004]|nr:hypothetical protein [Synechococcales cyanobacterium M55_K2018_004]